MDSIDLSGPKVADDRQQPREPGAESGCHRQGSCLTFSDLTLGYETHPAVHGLTGTVPHGSLLALIGPNGSGKSTLLKGIMGQLTPMAGSCTTASCCRIAYLPQQAAIDISFPVTVADLVGLGLWPKRGLLGRLTRADRAALEAALAAVGLSGFARRGIDTLSGGQLQRALFARVILQDADLILLDEPFNAIDEQTVSDLMSLIDGWNAEGRTVIAVLHDLDLVRRRFPQALLLSRDPLAWGATKEVLTPANLRKAAGFKAAWDEMAPWCQDDHHDHTHDHPHGHRHDHSQDGNVIPMPAKAAGAGS